MSERARQDVLRRSGPPRAMQPIQRDDRAGSGPGYFVVLREIDGDVLHCQRLRYTDNPPQVGRYEAVGAVLDAYPMTTAVASDFAPYEWAETVTGDGDPMDNPVTTGTVPLLAIPDLRGFLMVCVAPKFEVSLLDPEQPANECGEG